MLPSRCLFPGRSCLIQQDNDKPHTASFTTAWLHSRRVQVPFTEYTKTHFVHHETQSTTKKTQDCKSYIRQEWDTNPLPKVQQQFPDIHRPLLKEAGMLHSWKHGPVPTFLSHVAAFKFYMSKQFSLNSMFYIFCCHFVISVLLQMLCHLRSCCYHMVLGYVIYSFVFGAVQSVSRTGSASFTYSIN